MSTSPRDAPPIHPHHVALPDSPLSILSSSPPLSPTNLPSHTGDDVAADVEDSPVVFDNTDHMSTAASDASSPIPSLHDLSDSSDEDDDLHALSDSDTEDEDSDGRYVFAFSHHDEEPLSPPPLREMSDSDSDEYDDFDDPEEGDFSSVTMMLHPEAASNPPVGTAFPQLLSPRLSFGPRNNGALPTTFPFQTAADADSNDDFDVATAAARFAVRRRRTGMHSQVPGQAPGVIPNFLHDLQPSDPQRAEELLAGLEIVTPELLSSEDCILCAVPESDTTHALPCAHLFHTGCLKPWFSMKTTCPTCRFDIDPNSLTFRQASLHDPSQVQLGFNAGRANDPQANDGLEEDIPALMTALRAPRHRDDTTRTPSWYNLNPPLLPSSEDIPPTLLSPVERSRSLQDEGSGEQFRFDDIRWPPGRSNSVEAPIPGPPPQELSRSAVLRRFHDHMNILGQAARRDNGLDAATQSRSNTLPTPDPIVVRERRQSDVIRRTSLGPDALRPSTPPARLQRRASVSSTTAVGPTTGFPEVWLGLDRESSPPSTPPPWASSSYLQRYLGQTAPPTEADLAALLGPSHTHVPHAAGSDTEEPDQPASNNHRATSPDANEGITAWMREAERLTGSGRDRPSARRRRSFDSDSDLEALDDDSPEPVIPQLNAEPMPMPEPPQRTNGPDPWDSFVTALRSVNGRPETQGDGPAGQYPRAEGTESGVPAPPRTKWQRPEGRTLSEWITERENLSSSNTSTNTPNNTTPKIPQVPTEIPSSSTQNDSYRSL
ncbi:hypothetical protein SISNIDRAFT_447803 [Sistotremastrum niveocremeum HHB9708]|uniref:RING-type domain-containing protein n=1 Tax=Sistotremastrum niveocremeum HHB9708 TaxID=1314777 RepID=A0A165AGL9_9AGAM|nr:hypothetical protein SISNIDRAFT_447803 [Sistotremastrum niveocremeum HHB9708]